MATIPYATVENVEARLGYELGLEEVDSLEAFLTDFSLIIQTAFLSRGRDIELLDSRLLTLVVARRGVDFVLSAELLPGQTAFSETVGDRSISGSVSSSASYASSMDLTKQELKLLGLSSRSSIYSIEMVTRDDLWRRHGGY